MQMESPQSRRLCGERRKEAVSFDENPGTVHGEPR